MKLTRRQAFGFAALLTSHELSFESLETDLVKGLLLSVVSDPALAKLIGHQYLKDAPNEELVVNQLIDRLRHEANNRGVDSVTHTANVLIEDDLSAGKVVSLGGWVVARSEARLFAMCAKLL